MRSLNIELAGFTGTEEYHTFSGLYPGYYITDGVKYAADNYGLYWFLDIICSYQLQDNVKNEPFQLWTLKRTVNDAFIVTADDGNGNILQKQKIPYSDFVMDQFNVYLVDKIILLPSEN
jgi:hypothetical protein